MEKPLVDLKDKAVEVYSAGDKKTTHEILLEYSKHHHLKQYIDHIIRDGRACAKALENENKDDFNEDPLFN